MEYALLIVGGLFIMLAIDLPMGRRSVEDWTPSPLKTRLINFVIGALLITLYLLFFS